MDTRMLVRLSRTEIDGPELTSREQSLAIVADRVSTVIEARQALRDDWARHIRQHGPERDPFVRSCVEQALGRRTL